ncbi:hypothetical protein, partial [Bifidobacterium vansinderenii]|uniref:hypothetical protein n=1 Tax=Bifidobacterium vansinderenii TaxID=1984871 RepID=UPI001E4DDBC9
EIATGISAAGRALYASEIHHFVGIRHLRGARSTGFTMTVGVVHCTPLPTAHQRTPTAHHPRINDYRASPPLIAPA